MSWGVQHLRISKAPHTRIFNNWNNLLNSRNFSQHECVSPWDQSKESLGNFQEILIFETCLEAAAIHSTAEDLSGMDGERV